MATTLTYGPYLTIATLLSTELNSLANGAYSSLSSARGSDSTGGPLFGDFELVLNTMDPTANVLAELYILRAVDGTNYATTPSSTNPNLEAYVGTFTGDSGNNAKNAALYRVELPPGLWKVVLKNVSGVAFASSGNTLKVREYNLLST